MLNKFSNYAKIAFFSLFMMLLFSNILVGIQSASDGFIEIGVPVGYIKIFVGNGSQSSVHFGIGAFISNCLFYLLITSISWFLVKFFTRKNK